MNDVLDNIVRNSHLYLGKWLNTDEYRRRMVELMRDANENDLKALADVLSAYAIHLRTPH